MSYISDCLQKFRALPLPWQEEIGGLETYRKLLLLEEKYGVELGFLVILVTIGELDMEDIEEYLEKKYELSANKSTQIKQDLQSEIFEPALQKLFPENAGAGPIKTFDIKEEKGKVLDVFKSGLKNMLTADKKTIQDFNVKTFYILAEDSEFENEILKTLSVNKEKITGKKFVMAGKETSASIGNWLEDFIKRNGSEMFDNVTMSRYVTTSENGKILNKEEREMVQKILRLYRNLKFFPESMDKVPVENWEIIPIDHGIDATPKARPVGPPRTVEEKKIDELKGTEVKYAKGSLEERAIEEEIANERRASELKIEANKYKEGSLERKAIEEEIRKLEV